MTFLSFLKYKWCDASGVWHSGHPPAGTYFSKVEGCDLFRCWHDCTSNFTRPDGTVEGTSGHDVIDAGYRGDPEGDKIDNGDAILTGAAPNDDLVYGFDGDDHIQTFDGNDIAYGGKGNDVIDDASGTNQGSGNDTFHGDEGHDKIWGGVGHDALFGGADNDYVDGEEDNDFIDGGTGDDHLRGGSGDDKIIGGKGNDSIDGGTGNDRIYGDTDDLGGTSAKFRIDWDHLGSDGHQTLTSDGKSVSVSINTPHNAQGKEWAVENGMLKNWDVSDPSTADLHFDQAVTNVTFTLLDVDRLDKITIMAKDAAGNLVPVSFENTGVHEVDGNMVTGTQTNAPGPDANNTGQDIDVTIPGPITDLWIVLDDGPERSYSGAVAVTDITFELPVGGLVDGGDDTIDGGDGDDVIFGNGGNDSILGGTGNDTIYGDNGGSAPGAAGRENFQWEGLSDSQIDGSVVQNTGTVSVTYTRTADTGSHDSSLGTVHLNTDGIDAGDDAVDTDSSLQSVTNGHGNTGAFKWEFSEPVTNVAFNVNDLDGDGVVKITAFDAAGNPIPVTLTAGGGVSVLDTDTVAGVDTADSNGGYADPNTPNYTVNVSIAGPVSRIVLEHTQNGSENSGINVTEIFFDSVTDGDVTAGGNDIIDGGEGDDVIYGEGGDDTVLNGAGADKIFGGADADTIIGGNNGDVVDGGTDGDDNDVLDLRGLGPVRITETVDPDGDSTSGRVDFIGPDGAVTGSLEFREIEKILTDPSNAAPDAVADALAVNEDDAPGVIGNVLSNDTDPDSDTLAVNAVNGNPANVGQPVAGDNGGLITINPDGSVTFDPNGDFEALGAGDTATTTISYSVSDGNGGTDTASVTITVNGVNDAPDATDNSYVIGEDEDSGDIDGNAITDNTGNGVDTDVDSPALSVVGVGQPAGNVGTPVAASAGGLVTITANGAFDFDANGAFDYLAPGETATTSVTYTISDGEGGTATATLTFTVTGTNDGPVAVADSFPVGEDDPAAILGNVLDNDSDPEDDPLTVSEVNGSPTNVGQPVPGDNGGLVTINPDGTVSFDPNGDFDDLKDGETATTTVTYTVTDPDGATSTVPVTFTVTGTNDAPVAEMDAFTAGVAAPVDLGNVLDNDSDPEDDDLSVTAVDGNPAAVGTPVPGDNGGLITINPDGTVSFDPNGDFDDLKDGETATTTVTYSIDDGNGGSDDAVVTITVNGKNDDPTATDNAYAVSFSEGVGDVDGNVLTDDTGAGVDSDPEGDTLKVVGVGAPNSGVGVAVAGTAGGLFIINEDGTVDFDANGDFDGLGKGETATTSVEYTISDGNGGFDTATASFTVTGTNDGTVSGTSGDDIINPTIPYVDADGDVVDGNDAILPGDTGNDDLIEGLEGNDRIDAGDGNDEVYGGADNDLINGNAGNDTLFGDDGNDTVNGGLGNDRIFGGDGNDTVNGQDGNDVISGGNDDDMINGGAGDDVLSGDAGNDKIEGSEGRDTITGGMGDDDLWGGEDDDDVRGGQGNDTIGGGDGDDVLKGAEGDDSISGGTGNDDIDGGAGDDDINGNAGDDKIVAGTGSDTVEGGAGNDVIDTGNHVDPAADYDYPGASIPGLPIGDNDANPDNDKDTVFGGAGDDRITTGDDADFIDGGTGNDYIDAGIDDDSIIGGLGDDTIIGSQGEDIIAGNEGNDLIYGGLVDEVLDLPDAVDPAPDDNRDTINGGDGNDTIYGRDDADTLFGDAGNDEIYGGIDDDSVNGGAGNDLIFGDQGNDSITGEAGDDTLFGGTGDDFVTGGKSGNDEVHGDDGNDTVLGGTGNDTLFGGSGNDTMAGDLGDDTIFGEDGDDSIQAGVGDDTIYGGSGDDVIRGNVGSDIIEGGDGDDFIEAGDNPRDEFPDQDYPGDGVPADPDPFDDIDVVDGGAGNDFIRTGDDADTIFGGTGDDVIDAGIDNDVITGGEGADVITAGLGSDLIIGGTAGDVVIGGEDPDDSDIDVLDLTGSNVDRIAYVDGDPEAGTVFFKDGTTMTFSEIENVIPCFTPGTTIATPRGERLVEELQVGDKIITRDNGIQEIAWVGHKQMDGTQLARNPHLKPILIKAGALGHGLPERDMLVSPNHRILVASEMTQLYFEESEVLAAAKHMAGADGIHAVNVMATTYVHFMFERHEVVLSNGAWTESFQPGDYSLKGIGNGQRNEIFELFPELATKKGLEGYQSARKALKKHEARLLLK